MGKSGKRQTTADIAVELSRRSAWPPRFIGLPQRKIEHTIDELAFHDVTLRCFPLRAKMSRLESFCERYLGVGMEVPEGIADFRPAGPWVLFAVINYGRMSAAKSNLGWSAQNEIMFQVPLIGRWNEWDEDKREARMVQDFSTVAPFIFVDDDWSVAAGREIYGWPKVTSRLQAGLNTWLRDPRRARLLMRLQTLVVPKLYAGQEAELETLLEIEQDTPRAEVPAALDYVMNPLMRLSKSMVGAIDAVPDLVETLAGLMTSPKGSADSSAGASPAPIASVLSRLFQSLTRMPPDLYGNTVNLKQFRAPLPGAACYQSLNNAKMAVTRFNQGGLMGSGELFRGDPTGGFSILLYEQDAYPIVESLGLEVDAQIRRDGKLVSVLRPLLPFWMSLDLRYEKARRICWRAERPKSAGIAAGGQSNGGWQRWLGSPEKPPESTGSHPVGIDHLRPEPFGTTSSELPSFNTALGPVVEAVQGPFDFHDVTIRVLPLRASSDRLREALPSERQMEPYRPVPRGDGDDDSWVYLVVTSYGRMSSKANNIGWWARSEVGFAFVAESTELIGLATRGFSSGPIPPAETRTVNWLHWPYVFADSPIAVSEGREVLGLPTRFCRIAKGEDPWLEADGPEAHRRLLSLSALDYPAAGVGQQAVELRLFGIERAAAASPTAGDESMVRRFLDHHLANFKDGLRIRNLSVKEFRDEDNPDQPCYQSVVAFDRTVSRRKGRDESNADKALLVEPMPGRYQVRFHRTPSYDIVDSLGLEVARLDEGETGAMELVCDVVDPFWLRVDMRAELPMDLIQRSVNKSWSLPGYLPFTYNELSFPKIYEHQIEIYEKVMKSMIGRNAGVLPEDSLSAEELRKMNELRREWTSDPLNRELKSLDDLVRELRGHRKDAERDVVIKRGAEVSWKAGGKFKTAAEWQNQYLGVWKCTHDETREEFEIEIALKGWGLDAAAPSPDEQVRVLWANVIEGKEVATLDHVDLMWQSLYIVSSEGELVDDIFCTDDFRNRLTFHIDRKSGRATKLTWQMGIDLDRDAEPFHTWTGVRLSGPPERKPAKKTTKKKQMAKKKTTPKKTPESKATKKTAAKKESAKRKIVKPAKPRWPDPEVLESYEGTYRVSRHSPEFVKVERERDARQRVVPETLLCHTHIKPQDPLRPTATAHVFESRNGFWRLSFRYEPGGETRELVLEEKRAKRQSWSSVTPQPLERF
ncbi:MAG: hypothetical protein ACE5GX_15830 [Thermoanaerobaculia bacterium]